jgi:hypothetical protein
MFHRAGTYLVLSLFLGAAQVAGCVGAEESPPGAESDVDTREAPAEGFYCTGDRDPEASCPDQQADSQLDPSKDPVQSYSGGDWYFHPNNGAHGGWIEAWRLCNEGGQNFRICTGGYAPVRYWNPSSCGGTIQDYYPQGWSGWAQTGGGCG